MDPAGDPDVVRVWSLLSEVSEQLSQNRSSAVNLHALADGAKVRVQHLPFSTPCLIPVLNCTGTRLKLFIRKLALYSAGVYFDDCSVIRV